MKPFKRYIHHTGQLLRGRVRVRQLLRPSQGRLQNQEAARFPEGETDPEDDDAPAEDPGPPTEENHATSTRFPRSV